MEWKTGYYGAEKPRALADRTPDPVALAAGCKEPKRTRLSAYKGYGCRCSACVEAMRNYDSQRRRSRAQQPSRAKYQQLADRFGERLSFAMRRRGVTSAAFSTTLGIRHRTVCRWLAGLAEPQGRWIGPICKALRVKASFFTVAPTQPETTK